MKNVHKLTQYSYELCKQFYKDERGVYMYLGGMLGFVLLGLAALAVDGSGIYLDKARFVQGMDQAALALAAENNTKYRQNKANHADVSRQILGPEHANKSEAEKFSTRQEMRNQELAQGWAKVYMRSYNRSNLNDKSQPVTIEKDFNIDCREETYTLNQNAVKKPIVCALSGEIRRKSWLPLDNNVSFDKNVDINSGVTYGVKEKGRSIPMDVMLVSDFSGSMLQDINGKSGTGLPSRISMLRDVVAQLEDILLPEVPSDSVSPYNRMAFAAFSGGVQQRGNKAQCVLPYYGKDVRDIRAFSKDIAMTVQASKYKDRKGKEYLGVYSYALGYYIPLDQAYYDEGYTSSRFFNCNLATQTCKVIGNPKTLLKAAINYADTQIVWSVFNYYFDLNETIRAISSFNGKDRSYELTFNKNAMCLGDNSNSLTTNLWFTQQNRAIASNLKRLEPDGWTAVSSGTLIGANLLMDTNKDPKAQPSELGTNTRRVLLILSDGEDNTPTSNTVVELINAGMCEKLRERLDSLQVNDPSKDLHPLPTRMGFVALGYTPSGAQAAAWKKCVGPENYYADVKNKASLLEAFKQIIGIENEVGKSSITRPKF